MQNKDTILTMAAIIYAGEKMAEAKIISALIAHPDKAEEFKVYSPTSDRALEIACEISRGYKP